jgi:hypothetical protein
MADQKRKNLGVALAAVGFGATFLGLLFVRNLWIIVPLLLVGAALGIASLMLLRANR